MTGPTRQPSLATRSGRRASPLSKAETEEHRDGCGVEGSDAIASEVRRGRALDRDIAQRLDQRETAPASTGEIHELGQRARLPTALEQRLIREAIAGDRGARAQLVEAFLPLIGSVARNYRSSPQIT